MTFPGGDERGDKKMEEDVQEGRTKKIVGPWDPLKDAIEKILSCRILEGNVNVGNRSPRGWDDELAN